MAIRRICLLFVSCCVLLIFSPTNTGAFSIGNPFKAAERALGNVARGIGNIFGQGLAGLASPTINAFSDDINKVLAENLVRADNILAARITQVDSILGKQLNDLDDKLSKKIQKFDEIMDQKIGAVDIVATKAVQNAEDSLISVMRFGAILILLASLIFVLARLAITRAPREMLSSTALVTGIATIVLAAFFAIGASYLFDPPAGARIAKLGADFEKAALAAYRHGEMNDASTYAKQLTVIDPTSLHYAAFQKVTEIQRDILYRPTTLKSAAGANELLPRVRRLEQFATDPAMIGDTKPLSRFVSQEVAATSAVILWQLAQTKQLERDALCSAADALTTFDSSGELRDASTLQSQATPFVWLSYGYVKWGEMLNRGSAILFKCPDGTEFSKTLAKLQPLLGRLDSTAPPDSIAHIVTFNRAAVREPLINGPKMAHWGY